MHWGVVLPVGCSADDAVSLSRYAEALGVGTVWFVDTVGARDPVVLGVEVLANTDHIQAGLIFVNPVSRPWPILTSTLLTLDESFPGRVTCGVARGDALARVKGMAQVAMCSPEELEHSVHALSDVLGRRTGQDDGVPDYGWAAEPATIPLLVAGLAPRVIGVAAHHADGLIYQIGDVLRVGLARRALDEMAHSAGGAGPMRLVVNVPAVVGEDVAQLADAVDWFVQMAAGHALDLVTEELPSEALADPLTTYVRQRPPELGAPTETAESRRLRRACAEQMCLLGPIEKQLERIHELESKGATDLAMMLVPGHERSTLDAYAHAGVLGHDARP